MAINTKIKNDDVKKATATVAEAVKTTTEAVKTTAETVKTKAEAAKPVVEEKAEAVKKAATKTAAATKKTATKAVKKAKKEVVKSAVIQYQGLEFSTEDCMKKAEAAFKKDYKGKTLEEINIYIKPEERRIYYVANKDCVGSVEL